VLSKYKASSPVVLTPPESARLPLAAIPDTVFDLERNSDDEDDRTTVSLPLVPVQEPPLLAPPVDLQPPLIPPAVPVVPAAAPRRTMCVSCPPGEWWKVKHPAEPEPEAAVIWSDDEEENAPDGQQVNSVSGQEPRTFKQAMQGSQSD